MIYINEKEENRIYRKRPGAYAIMIHPSDQKIGIVTDGENYFYFGGGMEEGESRLEALTRELLEETGYTIKNIKEWKEVGSYFYDKKKGYLDVIASVYLAEFDQKIAEKMEQDHTILWIEPEEYVDKMYSPWQRYIMKQWIESRKKENENRN